MSFSFSKRFRKGIKKIAKKVSPISHVLPKVETQVRKAGRTIERTAKKTAPVLAPAIGGAVGGPQGAAVGAQIGGLFAPAPTDTLPPINAGDFALNRSGGLFGFDFTGGPGPSPFELPTAGPAPRAPAVSPNMLLMGVGLLAIVLITKG